MQARHSHLSPGLRRRAPLRWQDIVWPGGRQGWAWLAALAILLGCLCPGRAPAAEIAWRFPLEEGRVAFIEIRAPDGALIGEFKAADDRPWDRFGWRPDEDDRRGWVAGGVDSLALPAGRYPVDLVLPGATLRQELVVDTAGEVVEVVLPPGGSGAVAFARGESGGIHGLAWAPDPDGDGQVLLPVGAGLWDVYAQDVPALPARYPDEGSPLRVVPAPAHPTLAGPVQETGLLRGILLPVTAIILAVAALVAWMILRWRGAALASVASLGLGAWICRAVALDLSDSIACRFPRNYKDPFDSVFFTASFQDSILHLSDVTHQFAWPAGASWLGTGPAWLAYLVPGALSHLMGPVAAMNLGLIFLLGALGVASWALARELGAGPWTALVAGGGALVAPLVVAEIDKASLDRLCLFPIPIFFLCLHRAARREGWRWPILAGVALAAVFYGQVYYGIYLAAACPLLILPLVVGRAWRGRLARMILVGAVGGALIAPGLYLLRVVTAGSAYDAQPFGLLRDDGPLWPPVSEEEALAYFAAHDMRLKADPSLVEVERQPDLPMETSRERVLAAATSGMFLKNFLKPINHLPGEARFWPLILASVVLAARRRVALAMATQVAILIIYSLGPFLRTSDSVVMVPLPYYLNLLFIPGFDQLKNLYRYRLMAATVAAVPMALGLEGLVRLLWRLGPARVALPRLAPLEWAVAGVGIAALASTPFSWPVPYAVDRSAVISSLDAEPAVVLPVEATRDDPAAILALVDRGIPVVGELPLEPLRRSGGSLKVFEEVGLLSRLADLSGARRLGRFTPLVDLEGDRAWAREQGMRYVILLRRAAAGAELVGRTTAFMDARFARVGQDDSVTAWDLDRPLRAGAQAAAGEGAEGGASGLAEARTAALTSPVAGEAGAPGPADPRPSGR